MLSHSQIEKIKTILRKNYNERFPVIFNALSDPCRFFIFQLLFLQKKVCVTDIANICKISVSAASQQLKILELTGIVAKKRMGQMVCYTLKEKDPIIQKLIKMILQ